ncbi:hypothetical protein Ddye_030917 [Dipteronia dyeriana]|uniref:Uncharacterized protein n=1 Tax=Dipteronia dyeriana TaxID=168575 RepID=A0AAD9THA7_9ROSI|nr:hypothetical protein Ddye_030917 [Dipteronia dyeriana]
MSTHQLPPRVLKLQQQQNQLPPRMCRRRCLPPRLRVLQEENLAKKAQQAELPPRMRRRCLPPRMRLLQEEKLAKATPQPELSLSHQQLESLHARVEHLTQLLNIQLHLFQSQEASIQQLLLMQQEKQPQKRVLIDHLHEPVWMENQHIQSDPQQNKFKSNVDYSKLTSFLVQKHRINLKPNSYFSYQF